MEEDILNYSPTVCFMGQRYMLNYSMAGNYGWTN